MKNWNTDRILSITSMLVGLLTLILFVYELNLTRKQQFASVLPYVSVGHQGVYGDNYVFFLKNDGLGPAFITDFRIIDAGKVYQVDPAEYFQTVTKNRIGNYIISNLAKGQIIPAGGKIELIAGRDKKVSDTLTYFFAKKTIFEIAYKSIYDEEWISSSTTPVPSKK